MKKTTLLLMVILFASSCRKGDKNNFDGPNLNDLFGPFSIIDDIKINKNTANFPLDNELYFSGELSKNTTWIISITGEITGAKRTITGSDRILSINNTAWDGGANTFPGFGLENAFIEISFPKE